TVMHWRAQLLIPAAVLIVNKLVGLARDQVALFDEGEAIGTRFGITIFDLLDKAGDSNLKKFVLVTGGDGKKLQALEQRVAFILGLLQHTTIEGQPGCFAIKVVSRIVERGASHKRGTNFRMLEPSSWLPDYFSAGGSCGGAFQDAPCMCFTTTNFACDYTGSLTRKRC